MSIHPFLLSFFLLYYLPIFSFSIPFILFFFFAIQNSLRREAVLVLFLFLFLFLRRRKDGRKEVGVVVVGNKIRVGGYKGKLSLTWTGIVADVATGYGPYAARKKWCLFPSAPHVGRPCLLFLIFTYHDYNIYIYIFVSSCLIEAFRGPSFLPSFVRI